MSAQLGLFEAKAAKESVTAPAVVEPVAASEGFDLKKFVESFPTLAAAEGAILRLREMVLSLALGGMLSQSNSSTSTASSSGGWRWVAVSEVSDCVLGKMLDSSKHTKGKKRPYLRNINVRWGRCDLDDLLEMFFEDDELERYGVRPGDVLICEGGEPGRAAVWSSEQMMLIQKAIHRVRPSDALHPHWLVLNLRRDSWSGRLENHFTGATIKHFTGRSLASYRIPLPPLEEQRRIVAKVDELMALLDDLEAQQAKARQAQTRFRASALEALTRAAGPEELAAAWARVAGSWEVLFERAESVESLRQSVLDLAVRGRLVVSASATGNPPKPLVASPVLRGGSVPSSWSIVPLVEVAEKSRGSFVNGPFGSDLLTNELRQEGVPVVYIRDIRPGRYVRRSTSCVTLEKAKALSVCSVRPGDVVIAKVGTPPGYAAVYPGDEPMGVVTQDVIRIRVDRKFCDARFVMHFLNSPLGGLQLKPILVEANRPRFALGQYKKIAIALPPLEEQQRIVDKVDALMMLCDDLEAKLKAREATAAKLVEAVVRELVAPAGGAPSSEAPASREETVVAAEGPVSGEQARAPRATRGAGRGKKKPG